MEKGAIPSFYDLFVDVPDYPGDDIGSDRVSCSGKYKFNEYQNNGNKRRYIWSFGHQLSNFGGQGKSFAMFKELKQIMNYS